MAGRKSRPTLPIPPNGLCDELMVRYLANPGQLIEEAANRMKVENPNILSTFTECALSIEPQISAGWASIYYLLISYAAERSQQTMLVISEATVAWSHRQKAKALRGVDPDNEKSAQQHFLRERDKARQTYQDQSNRGEELFRFWTSLQLMELAWSTHSHLDIARTLTEPTIKIAQLFEAQEKETVKSYN